VVLSGGLSSLTRYLSGLTPVIEDWASSLASERHCGVLFVLILPIVAIDLSADYHHPGS
jgi:hypothetical protein